MTATRSQNSNSTFTYKLDGKVVRNSRREYKYMCVSATGFLVGLGNSRESFSNSISMCKRTYSCKEYFVLDIE